MPHGTFFDTLRMLTAHSNVHESVLENYENHTLGKRHKIN